MPLHRQMPRIRLLEGRAVALLLIYRFLVTPGVVATVCESYTDEATCNNVITSSGSCLWQNGECTTQLGTLPPGMVAISVALERPGTPSSTSASGTGVSSPPPPSPNPAPRPEAEMPGLEPEFEDEPPFPGRRLLETGECIDSPTPDTFSCEQQRAWGKCAEQWMVVGGFCQLTCGVCIPQPPTEVLPPPAEVASVSPQAEFCSQAVDSGPCKAAITRWTYDGSKGSCTPFVYGGCKGNANNFETLEQCTNASVGACGAKKSRNIGQAVVTPPKL
ncbi:hypothetical protein ACKKBG_A32140 [Auxenochlorella protothecoides x Auxenochlorella symbiontica]